MSDKNKKDKPAEDAVSTDEMVEALYEVRDEIKKFADIGKKLKATGLKERAILVLLRDMTGLPMTQVKAVLLALENFGDEYLKKGAKK